MNKKEKTITPRFEENIIETLDIREMKGKYLAEAVQKRWKEKYTDQETGEVIDIERSQMLMKKGTLMDYDKLQMMQFNIECGDVTEPVKLTDTKRTSKSWGSIAFRPMAVQISNGLRKTWVLLWACDLVMAQEIAKDFCEQILSDDFFIYGVKYLKGSIINRQEFYERQAEEIEKLDIVLNPITYYQIDAWWKEEGTPYPFIRPSKEALEHLRCDTFYCMADSLDEAKELVAEEIRIKALKDDDWKHVEICFKKGMPFSAGIIVPKSFCDSYEKYYIREQKKRNYRIGNNNRNDNGMEV